MPDDNTRAYEANRARWDEAVPIHVASQGYDVEGFLRGEPVAAVPDPSADDALAPLAGRG